MNNAIIHCCKENILTSLYFDCEDRQKHYTGYIMNFTKDEILIAHISHNGYYDGYIWRHIDDVYRIDYGGEYERRIETLYKARKQTHNALSISENSDNLFLSALESAKINNLVVSLIIDDDCRTGLIKNYDRDIVRLWSLNDNGKKDGVTIVRCSEILVLEIDTDYEQDLKLLYQKDNGSVPSSPEVSENSQE